MDKNSYYKKMGIKIAVLIVVLIGLFLLYKMAMFYIPFIIALLIASVVEPIIKFLTKRLKFNRKFAAIVSLLLVFALLSLLVTLGVTKLVEECKNLIANSNDSYRETYNYFISYINDIQNGNSPLPNELAELAKKAIQGIIDGANRIATGLGDKIITGVSSLPTMITYIIITILATIFTCFDRQFVLDKISSQVPKKWIDKTKEVYTEMCSVSWNYIKAEVKLSTICFIWVLVGLIIFDLCGLNVKYTILMAVLIGFIDLLPIFGAGSVMIPWSIYLGIMGDMPLAIAIICLWGVWAVLRQIIEPHMVSKQIGMHPLITLIAMYTGFKIIGVLGLMVGPIICLILLNVFRELLKKGILKSFFEME